MNKILCLCAVFLAGCGTVPVANVKIESDPPGAHVFMGMGPNEQFAKGNRQFLGTTPFTYVVHPKGDGSFPMSGVIVYSVFVPPVEIFFAEPPSGQTNLFAKQQAFHSGTIATPADKVPQGLFFDLTKP